MPVYKYCPLLGKELEDYEERTMETAGRPDRCTSLYYSAERRCGIMDWIDFINFGIACGGFIVAILGLCLTFINTYLLKQERYFFIIFFTVLASYIASDLVSQFSLVSLREGFADLSRIAVFLESLFSSMLMPLLTVYLLGCIGRKPFQDRAFFASLSLFAVYVLLLIITQLTKGIYYISEDNVYNRGCFYPVLLIPPALLMLLNLMICIRNRKKFPARQKKAFYIYTIIPLLCMVIQMYSYGLLLIVFGTSVSAMLMFLIIQTNQTERYIHQREEIAKSQARVQILQMRPHFIYNTMTSIYYLCEQDPALAKKAILTFNNYLKLNFAAIVADKPVLFREEMEHVRAYLSIEQIRFKDQLFVNLDIPYTAFRIPPLTIQPLVENSVKYGLGPELDPLYITITSARTETGIVVTVEDTGPGFDVVRQDEDYNHPHIAIQNIRERLALMCNGTLTFTNREGGGTVATIRIRSKKPTGHTEGQAMSTLLS